jgi:hypothetical protein
MLGWINNFHQFGGAGFVTFSHLLTVVKTKAIIPSSSYIDPPETGERRTH